MVNQVTLSFDMRYSNDTDIVAGSVTVTPSAADWDSIDDQAVIPVVTTGIGNAFGIGTVLAFPNLIGLNKTTATITLIPATGVNNVVLSGLIIPFVSSTLAISTLVEMQPALRTARTAGKIVMDQAAFDAAREADPLFGNNRTIYII